MAIKNENGIMGKLYYNVLKAFLISIRNSDAFFKFLNIQCNAPAQSDIFKYDYFPASVKDDFELRLTTQNTFVEEMDAQLKWLSPGQLEDINSVLINIVSTDLYYSPFSSRSGNFDERYFKKYSSLELSSLKAYYSAKEQCTTMGYKIYILIYLAVFKRLPPDFYFGIHYADDLNEFNKEVTLKYGVTSKPGVRAILSLIEKAGDNPPNIFAMYEYADMLYYGSSNGPGRDINAAFKVYKSLADENNNTRCHPLAFWTLAYIYLNYHQSSTDLASCDTIPDIEKLSRLDQVKEAIRYAKYSYDLIGNAASANILGKISLLTDQQLPGIEDVKLEFDMEPPINYFRYAADNGYIYAHANIANIHLNSIFSDPDNSMAHLTKYLNEIKKQADQFEPWAANTLGRFYLEGTVINRETKEVFNCGVEYVDRKQAYDYFEKATKKFNDSNSGWAFSNMIINFPKKYIGDEDHAKLRKHMQRLKETNNIKAIKQVVDNFISVYSVFEDREACESLLSVLTSDGE